MRNTRFEIKTGNYHGIKKIVIGVLILIAVVSILSPGVYHLCDGYMDGIKSVLPNVAYKKTIVIGNTKVPYFISLVPVEKLRIYDAPNLKIMITPFGIKEIEYKQSDALNNVKIPKKTTVVELNCAHLDDLEIPDGVIEATLYNVSDDFLSNLELPESLKKLSVGGSGGIIDVLTEKGIQKLENKGSIEYLKIENSYLIEDVEINLSLKGLSILDFSNLESVTLNGDVEVFQCNNGMGDFNINGNVEIAMVGAVRNLLVSGKVTEYYGKGVKQITLDSPPTVLNIEYSGEENPVIPEGVEVLRLWIDNLDGLTLPESIKAARIIHQDGIEEFGNSDIYNSVIYGYGYGGYFEGTKDMEELTWPSLEPVTKYYSEPSPGSF